MKFLISVFEIAFIYLFLESYGLIATLKMLAFALIMLFDFLLLVVDDI